MANDDSAITIVVFCAFSRTTLPTQEDSLLRTFVKSVRRSYASCAKIILATDSDLNTTNYSTEFDEIRRYPIDRSSLLLGRCRAYTDSLHKHDWMSPVAFLDYDILIIKRFDEVFELDADILLTTRAYSKSMPINGGVVFLNNIRPEKSIAFYESVLSAYLTLPHEQLQWWGDQLSLARATLIGALQLKNGSIRTQSGGVVKIVSKDQYNFTPYDVDTDIKIPDDLDDVTRQYIEKNVKVAHFKGPRKHLMLKYF